MVSSQVLQKTIDELKAITRVNLAVLSLDGAVVASTSEELDGMAELAREFAGSAADSQMVQDFHFFKIYDDRHAEYILLAQGGSADAYMIGKIGVSTRSGWIGITLFRTFCWIIFFLWIFTTGRKNFTSV